jgi:hypothetical protein
MSFNDLSGLFGQGPGPKLYHSNALGRWGPGVSYGNRSFTPGNGSLLLKDVAEGVGVGLGVGIVKDAINKHTVVKKTNATFVAASSSGGGKGGNSSSKTSVSSTKVWAVVQIIGGAAEVGIAVAGGITTAPSGVGPVAAGLIFTVGMDNIHTGIRSYITDSPQKTTLNAGVSSVAETFGASKGNAETVGVDLLKNIKCSFKGI